jgi:general secretion pathway protein C
MPLDAQIEKHFWVVRAGVIVACSAFAATAVAHVIAATALAERADPIHRPAPVRPAASTPSRSGPDPAAALVARNIFCSTCVAEEPVTPSSPTTGPVATELPLRLVATNVSPVGERSFATIRNTTTGQQGAYRVGERIPGAGPLRSILGKFVEFDNQASRRLERISLVSSQPAPAAPAPRPVLERPRPSIDPRATRKELMAAVDAGVRKLDDHSYEVDRAVVTQMLANPRAATRGARIVPSVKDGKPNGFKLYAVRPTSVYARIGFKSGDTIHAINGFELNTMDKALEVYTKVREASSLSVTLTRRGKPFTLDYTIR